MSGVRMLVVVAPLRLTLWVLAGATAVIVVLIAIGMSRHLASARAARRRPGWGVIPRGEAILEEPAKIVTPLTR